MKLCPIEAVSNYTIFGGRSLGQRELAGDPPALRGAGRERESSTRRAQGGVWVLGKAHPLYPDIQARRLDA